MFVLDSTVLKDGIVTRNKALGYKMMQVAADVDNGDEVDMAFSDNAIVISKSDTQLSGNENENEEEAEISMLIKEFGVFGGVHSQLEVTLCDGAMLVTLVKGAIDINIDGQVMLASRGVSIDNICKQNSSEIIWVGLQHMLRNCAFWCNANSEFPYDYVYLIDVWGDSTNGATVSMRPTKKDAFLIDISNGGLELLEKQREVKSQMELLNSMMGKKKSTRGDRLEIPNVASKPSVESDDIDYDASLYDDDDDDDDDDIDDFSAY